MERDIDNIADEDRNAERKRRDMNARLNKLYEDISSIEDQIESCEQKQQAIAQNILTLETVYKMLGAFDKLIDIMDAADKRKLMEILIAEVQLHPKETWQEGKSPIKSIKYTFPISGKVLDVLGGNDFALEGCNVKNVHTVNFRSYKESYKDKHAIKRPPEEWTVFENTHEIEIAYMIQFEPRIRLEMCENKASGVAKTPGALFFAFPPRLARGRCQLCVNPPHWQI